MYDKLKTACCQNIFVCLESFCKLIHIKSKMKHTIYCVLHLTKSIYCGIIILLLIFVQFQDNKHTLFKFVRSQEV